MITAAHTAKSIRSSSSMVSPPGRRSYLTPIPGQPRRYRRRDQGRVPMGRWQALALAAEAIHRHRISPGADMLSLDLRRLHQIPPVPRTRGQLRAGLRYAATWSSAAGPATRPTAPESPSRRVRQIRDAAYQ